MSEIFLAVTIDVECDSDGGPTWQYSDPLTFQGVLRGIPERLQPFFEKFKAKPTYLVSNVILENEECVKTLSLLEGEYELGSHLHGEFIQPGKKIFYYGGAKTWDNQYRYDKEIELGKMKNLTNLFRERFGFSPVSFRAGRFSIGNNTVDILSKLGYKVDTSITPNIYWKDRSRFLDFRKAPEQPYFLNSQDILGKGNSNILEVPVSIIKRGLFKKVGWLRPSFSRAEEMVEVIKLFVEKYREEEYIILNMMFHNTEVIPRVNPHTKSEEECQDYLKRIEKVFSFAISRGISFATLSEIRNLYL